MGADGEEIRQRKKSRRNGDKMEREKISPLYRKIAIPLEKRKLGSSVRKNPDPTYQEALALLNINLEQPVLLC